MSKKKIQSEEIVNEEAVEETVVEDVSEEAVIVEEEKVVRTYQSHSEYDPA